MSKLQERQAFTAAILLLMDREDEWFRTRKTRLKPYHKYSAGHLHEALHNKYPDLFDDTNTLGVEGVRKWLTEKAVASGLNLYALADFFRVDPAELMRGKIEYVSTRRDDVAELDGSSEFADQLSRSLGGWSDVRKTFVALDPDDRTMVKALMSHLYNKKRPD